jgi:AcrR family transcriptional regulator
MPNTTANRQQLRTEETRTRLLDAAETLFVRDGYEGAQLAEISSMAGRTKGSVYAHFESKEDLFLALFEQRTRAYVERLHRDIEVCACPSEARAAFRAFYTGLAADPNWPILTLEFRLFALRHPESAARLRAAFAMTKSPDAGMWYERLFGPHDQQRSLELEAAISAMGPIVPALLLQQHFEPNLLPEERIRQLLGQIFDAFFPVPA